MIGLRRGTVKLVRHQSSWHKLFIREARRLQTVPDVVEVQHIGSTAIPGLRAKPIIDILVGVRSIHGFRKQLHRVTVLGYTKKAKITFPNRRFFFTKGPETRRTIHLHIQRYNGAKWKQAVFFRDWLIAHPRARADYEELKLRLAHRHGQDRATYTKGKKLYIQSILNRRK